MKESELSIEERSFLYEIGKIKGPLRRPQRYETYTIEAPKEKPSEIKKRQIKPKNLSPFQRKAYELTKNQDKMLLEINEVVDQIDRRPRLKRL